jgi:hypothetical protein
MALRDAVNRVIGARTFAEGLFDFLHGDDHPEEPVCRVVRGCRPIAEATDARADLARSDGFRIHRSAASRWIQNDRCEYAHPWDI